MKNKAINSSSMRFLEVQAELQSWEIINFPLLKNTSSRQLYYSIIKEHMSSTGAVLKGLYFGDGFGVTDRALRLKLREFESQGLITCEARESDRRSRRLIVTDDLMEKIHVHAVTCQKLFSDRFFFIER
jgi:hypothetical protein